MPVYKSVGDEVFGGTFCLDGKLMVRVKNIASESLFSKIIRLVLEAQEKKAEVETFIEKFANKYVPIVLMLFLGIMIIGPLMLGGSAKLWIYRGLVLLVLSCPCALTISVPAGMVAGIVNAAKNGILVKGGRYLETASDAKIVVLDKTGTLTLGTLEVTDIVSLRESIEPKYILQLASSIASLSNHPISKAIAERAKEEGIETLDVEKFKEHPGRGVSGIIAGSSQILVGNLKLLEENGVRIDSKLEAAINNIVERGNKIVYVALNNKLIGVIVLEDRLKPEAKEVIKILKKKGLRVVMMTGDDKIIAERIAGSLDIDEYYANMLPHEKAERIKMLSKQGDPIIFVGDGINDAPSIATADVGVAMGMRGIDVTIETADIVLANDNLMNIPYLIDLAKKTRGVVRFNVYTSIIFKLFLIILAIFGLVTLIEAVVIGDDGLAMLVAINSLRILRFKHKKDKQRPESAKSEEGKS